MIVRARALAACLTALTIPLPLLAETARVRGGEHADFTRIVVEASILEGWRFGKTARGYEFRAPEAISAYDLTRAFDKIPRSRVAGLWRDVDTGTLQFDIPCECHADAFEVRPGLVAIDLRNGAAPRGSAFEQSLSEIRLSRPDQPDTQEEASSASHRTSPDSAEFKIVAPEAREAFEYDWLEIAAIRRNHDQAFPEEEAEPSVALSPLRDALLRQVSRGIAEGVVEPGNIAALPDVARTPVAEAPGLRISNGELPGLRAATRTAPGPNLTASGRPCLANSLTDITSWRKPDGTIPDLAQLRAGLLGEFDAPVETRIIEATKAYISVGFGAEARQILGLQNPQSSAWPVLRDLSFLIDLEPAEGGTFVGMESCDTPAALWSVLALAINRNGEPAVLPNTAAITRSFSELPPDLRRHLSSVLVDYFLQSGDESTARRLRDAVMRAPGDPGQQAQLMDAGVELETGNSATAAKIAEEVMSDPGNSAADAAILIAESAFSGNRRVSETLAAQLKALSVELRGSDNYLRIKRSEILSLAMGGDFRAAFAVLPEAPETKADLWQLALKDAPDDIFLIEAIKARAPLTEDRLAVQNTAKRLLSHGFAEEALLWLGPSDKLIDESDRLLAAEAALAMRDARRAVVLLAGISDEVADGLRARAALQLGNADAAAAILLANGDRSSALRAEFWAGDWAYIADSDAMGLSKAAAYLLPDTEIAADEGALARSARLAAESEEAREAINGLMQALPQQFQ